MPPIRVAIVEPSQLFREGLQQLLTAPDFAVVAAAKIVTEALNRRQLSSPELVLWGPGSAGDVETEMAWVRRQARGLCRTRLVLVTDLSDKCSLRRMLMSGVDAILSQDVSSKVLQRSLSLVVLGQQLFPAELVKARGEHPLQPPSNLIKFPKNGQTEANG